MEYRLPHRFLPSLKGRHSCKAYFDTDPAKREKMNAIVRTELDNIVKSGPRDEDFKKSQDNILKRHTENLQGECLLADDFG